MSGATRQKTGTRQRLLEAAAEIYAEQGYTNARVRDICNRAGANVAAVNYHFGDKRALYDEVLRYAFFSMAGADPTAWDLKPEAGVRERLHAFIKNLLTQLITEGRSALYAKLVAREMANPTQALEGVIDDGIRPQIELLSSIIGQALGDAADEKVVRRCAGSILGQCLYYYFARPVIRHLKLEPQLNAAVIDDLADHITRFSLGGLTRMGGGG